MILADTSVWVEFFRNADTPPGFQNLIRSDELALHPYVEGELVLGGIPDRHRGLLKILPVLEIIDHESLCEFVRAHRLINSGIGWVDAHLLAAARRNGARLLTLDGTLAKLAQRLDRGRR